MPVKLVDENMERAHLRDAINTQKFYFRKNVLGSKNY
jgi:glutamate--cysteine ligase catalytic subunit